MREPGCDDDRDVEAEQAEAREIAEMRPFGEVLRDMDDARRLGALPKSRARTDEEILDEQIAGWRAIDRVKRAELEKSLKTYADGGLQSAGLLQRLVDERAYLQSLALTTHDIDEQIATLNATIDGMRKEWKAARDRLREHDATRDARYAAFLATTRTPLTR